MSPESVTLYQLEIPQNTPLFRAAYDGEPPAAIPSWPLKRARLARCFARLEAAGYTIRSAYAAVRDPDIIASSWSAAAVHHFATADDHVEVHGLGLELFASRLSQELPRHSEIAGEQTAVHREHHASDPGRLVRGQE